MLDAAPPPVAPAAQRAPAPDIIEVVGTRAGEALKIDRRSYRVQQTPHSAQKNAVQLLRGLPAVTVSPDESIALLGNTNVRIFVDGRAYAGDSTLFLRTLRGSDIERIEVITNPSAEYSAEGSAGIINFVLRKKQSDSTSGTVSVETFTPGGIGGDVSLKTKKGKWTVELGGAADTGRSHSRYSKLRSVEPFTGGPVTGNLERGGGPSRESSAYGSAKVTYDLDPNTSVAANFIAITGRNRQTNVASFRPTTPDFQPFDQRLLYASTRSQTIGRLEFAHKGSRPGETLSASIMASSTPHQHETGTSKFSTGGMLFTERLKRFRQQGAQFDWQHPMGERQILSLGGTWDRSRISEHYRFTSAGTAGLPEFAAADQFAGVDKTVAAYATFQQPLGDWTVMPGLRIEHDRRRVSSPGEADVHIDRTDIFPTLHVEHALSQSLTLALSYSKRIDRPSLNELRPYTIVQDIVNVKRGNPHLRNQATDAYEVNLHYHHGKVDAGLIIYDRETSGLWSTTYTAIGGVNVSMLVNSGHGRDRGAEIDVGTPLVGRFKINGSVNLFDQRYPVDDADGRRQEEQFRFTTNATLEWDGPERGKTPGDIAQLQWLYYSPYREFDIYQLTRSWLSLSYTHSFSRTWSLTASADYATRTRHRLEAPLVQEFFREERPAVFKVKLLKTFGKS